jgi:hypothetical protein
MVFARLRCRMIGLVAAYAVALHALLTGLAPVVPVALQNSPSIVCTHGGDRSNVPADHDSPCAAMCAALAQAFAAVASPATAEAIVWPQIVRTPAIANDWTPPRLKLAHRQAPRGPPSI